MDRELIADAYPDRFSQMTVLFFLSDEFEGGDTQFWVDQNDSSRPAACRQLAADVMLLSLTASPMSIDWHALADWHQLDDR